MKGRKYMKNIVREQMQIQNIRVERSITIDAIKGMAILLVVIGHCLQYVYAPNNYDQNFLFKIICSFHMPLFMFISGFLTWNSKRSLNLKWVKTRALKLVLPFIVWIFLDCLIRTNSLENIGVIIKRIIKSPDVGLWFLWILFLNDCLLLVVVNLSKKIEWLSYIVILTLLGFFWSRGIPGQFNYLGIYLVVCHFPFFLIGYLVHKYNWVVKQYLNQILFICFFGFVLLVGFWNRVEPPTFMPLIYQFAETYDIPTIFANCIRDVYVWIVPILGIGQSCLLLLKLKNNCLKKGLAYLGKYSMEVYIIHFYIICVVKTENILFNTIMGIVLGISIPIILSNILEKSKMLSLILFGKRV